MTARSSGISDKLTVGAIAVTFVQTFATAELTHAAPTATTLTLQGSSADKTLVDVTTAAVCDPAKVNANFNDVGDDVNKLIADVANLKGLVNSLIDELQRRALVG